MAHTKVTKTYSQNTGTANTFSYSGSFDVFKGTEVVALLDNVKLTYTASTINESASPREYTVDTSAKTIHIGGANLSSGTIIIRPETDMGDPTARATYTPGASITASDLNNNQTQLLRKAMEYDETKMSTTGDTMTGHLTMGEDTTVIFEGATDDGYETTLTVTDPTADRTITLPNVTGTVVTTGDTATVTATMLAANSVDSSELVDGSIDTSHIGNAQVTTDKLAADAVTGAKLADDAVDSEHYTDGSIDTAHIADSQVTAAKLASSAVTTAKINADAVTGAKIADDAIDSEHYTDGSIDTAHIADGQVTTAKIAADAITGAKIADDAIDSEHYAAGSIDAAHIATNTITATQIADDAITLAELADDAVDTAAIRTFAVTNGKIANDAVNGAKIADDSIDSEHYVDGSIDTAHIASAQVTDAKLASNAVTTAKITDSNVTTAKIADDAITIAKVGCEQTTISDSDSHIPTSGAVVDYVAAQIAPIGGLEVIADEDNFPTTQPSAGVVISIADAGGVVFNGSGVSTTARTAGNGSDNVTINGAPSSLYSETLAAGVGMQVSSTGSSHTYNYHKILATESDVKQLSDDINDFNARYRVNAGEPGSNNDEGDLVYDTNADKMKVYDSSSSAWKEVTSTGDFKFLVPVDAGTTTAASWDGSDTSFDLKETTNSGSAASVTNINQLIVSLNGVIQKPNTGSYSASEEGFYLTDADTIRFCTAPPSGSSAFIIQCGSAVSIPTPGDGTVSAAKIASGAVTTAKLADANVTTAKIADDAVTAAKIGPLAGDVFFDNGTNAGKDILWDESDDSLEFSDDTKAVFGTGGDATIYHSGSHTFITNGTGSLISQGDSIVLRSAGQENYLVGTANGSVDLYYDNSKKFETVTGGATITGVCTATSFAGSGASLTNLPAAAKNLLVNGAMQVAQRGTSSTSGGKQTVDQMSINDNNTNVTITQSQHDLTSGDTGPWALGFRKSFKIELSAAGNSLDGTSYIELYKGIEAQDLATSGWDYTSASSYVTFSFWFKASTNQTFYCNFRAKDGSNSPSYAFSFTASGNDTWTKITKSIPGVSGLTFDNNADAGLQLRIIPYYGGNYTNNSKSLNAWSTHDNAAYTPDYADTWITAGTSSFEITGLLLETGETASDYPHLNYGEELLACQRYYYRAFANNNEFFPGMGMADTDGNTVILNTQFPVQMRGAPTALEQSGTAADYKIRRSTTATCSSVPSFGHATKDQAATNFISSSHGFGDGSAVRCMSGGTDHYIAWSADI